jgi:hypothetical protein
MGSAVGIIIELSKMQKLIDRARIDLEVSDQLFIVSALLERRKAKLLIELDGFRHCANSERVHFHIEPSNRYSRTVGNDFALVLSRIKFVGAKDVC